MITATTQHNRLSLPDLVTAIQGQLQRRGVDLADMRRAGSLETDMSVPQIVLQGDEDLATLRLDRLEGPIVAREVARRNETAFSWFLDGSQKTLAVWRIGVVPIIVGIAAAGILHRDEDGECLLVGETLDERRTWFVPTQTGDRDLNHLIEALEEAGEAVRDPLARFAENGDMGQYQALAGNYGRLLYHAQETANRVRGAIEQNLVHVWNQQLRRDHPGEWLAVDGRLMAQIPNAVGLVKDPTQQHLFGDEASVLFSLPAGHRTTAYQLDQGGSDHGDDGRELRNQKFTMWYQRMWPAQGLDARHALIRVETSNEVWESELIDDIAAWLMAERIPRSTRDARWATLLYPVHLLELMLKRRIKAMTTGWPS